MSARDDRGVDAVAVVDAPPGHEAPRVRMLASLLDAAEARIVVDGGADLVDTKDVALGPIAALDLARVHAVVDAVARRVPVSAVIDEPGPDAGAAPRGEGIAARAVAGGGAPGHRGRDAGRL